MPPAGLHDCLRWLVEESEVRGILMNECSWKQHQGVGEGVMKTQVRTDSLWIFKAAGNFDRFEIPEKERGSERKHTKAQWGMLISLDYSYDYDWWIFN